MKNILIPLLLLLFSSQLFAEGVVIIHPQNVSAFVKDDVARIFLGKKSKFSNGTSATPYNLPKDHPIRIAFQEQILKKSQSRLESYWSKKVFTGKGKPPPILEDDMAVIEKVASDPSAIGYVDASMAAVVDDSVLVIITFK